MFGSEFIQYPDVFFDGCHPRENEIALCVFFDGCLPLNALIWYHMGAGLSIKIDYGGEKTVEMPQKRCFTGGARCGTIGA